MVLLANKIKKVKYLALLADGTGGGSEIPSNNYQISWQCYLFISHSFAEMKVLNSMWHGF